MYLLFIDFLEDVLKPAIILFEDSVFCAENEECLD